MGDITQTGSLSWKQLQEENKKVFADRQSEILNQQSAYINKVQGNNNALAELFNLDNSNIYTADTENILKSNFGESKYDKYAATGNQIYDNLNEIRAANQSRAAKLGNSLLNAGIIAGTTVLDSWLGLPIGLIQGLSTLAKGGSWSEARSSYTNNVVSSFLQNIQEKYSIPVYSSEAYNNASLWQKMGSANFWGESIIKNAGFMVGAMVAGYGTNALLSKAFKLDDALDVFKGFAVSAGEGKQTNNAVDLLQRYYKGDLTIKADDVAEAARKTAQSIKYRNYGTRIASTYIASDGEARIEAIGSARQYAENMDQIAQQVLAQGTSDEYLMQRIFDEHPEWFELQMSNPEIVGINGIQTPKLKNEFQEQAYAQLDMWKAEANLKYEQYQSQLKNDFNDYLNRVYLANLGVLLATNGSILGKLGSEGWSTTNKFVKYGGKTGKEGAKNVSKEGIELASKSVSKQALGALKIATSPLSEFFQETTQGVITRTADQFYGNRINDFYDQALYAEGLKSHGNFMSTLAEEFGSTLTDSDKWEEGIAGLITSLFGGGIYQDIKDYSKSVKETNKYIESYNSFAKDPNKSKYLAAIIRNEYYKDRMNGAVENNDKLEYKNAEYDQLLNNAMLYYSNGRKEEFKKIIDQIYSVETEEDAETIKSLAKGEDGTNPLEKLSLLEIKDKYAHTKEDILKTVDKVTKLSENLHEIWGNQYSSTFLDEIAYETLKIDNREERIKSITDKISKFINSKKAQLQNAGINVEELSNSIDTVKDLSVFFEEGEAEQLDLELSKLSNEKNNLKKHIEQTALKIEALKKQDLQFVEAFKNIENLEKELQQEDSDNVVEISKTQSQIDTLKNFVLNNEYTSTKSISSLKGILTKLEKKYNSLLSTSQDSKELQDIANKISLIKEHLHKRLNTINNLKSELAEFQESLSKFNSVSEDTISSQDVLDLVRLLAQRQSYIEKLNKLQKNPKKFENALSERLRLSYKKYLEKNANKYVEEFKEHKNPYLIPREYYKTVQDILEQNKEENKDLLHLLDLYDKYFDIIIKVYDKNKEDIELANKLNFLLETIGAILSQTKGVTLANKNEVVKQNLQLLKDNNYISETLYNDIIKHADEGITTSKSSTKKEKDNRKKNKKESENENSSDNTSLWEDAGESEDIFEEGQNEEEDIEEEEEKSKKQTKKEKTKIIAEDPLEEKEENKTDGAVYADGQKKPISPKYSSDNTVEDSYNEDSLRNFSGEATRTVGEQDKSYIDDNTIDALHVGRIHTKYNIEELQKKRNKVAREQNSVMKFLEKYHAYDFIDNGGMAEVLDYYSKKGKEVPIKIGTPNYIKGDNTHNNNMLAITFAPVGVIKSVNPAFKRKIGNKTYDFFIIGAIKQSDNKTISERFKNIRSERFQEKSKLFSNINIGTKNNPNWIKLSTFNTTLSWVYSGRVVTYKDENGNTQQRNLKDVLNNAQKSLVNEGKHPFTVVIMKRNDQPIYIGKQNIPTEKIVSLNSYRELTDDAKDWAGSVWVLVQEADGKYYHKSVKVKSFDKTFLEEGKDSDNYYIKGIAEALESLKEAKDEASTKESLRLLRDYLYWPNSNLYVKDGILYSTFKGVKDQINLDQAETQELLEFLSKFNFRFTFNEEIDLKTLVDSNILTSDLEQLNNVGASVIINSVEITENKDNPIIIHESSTVTSWKNEEMQHTGETDLRENKRHTVMFNNTQYIRQYTESGSVEYLKVENGKTTTVEDEDLIDTIEFLHRKNSKTKSGLTRRTLGGKVNKYTIWEMSIDIPNSDPIVKYFYDDGTKASAKQWGRLGRIMGNLKKKKTSENPKEIEESIKKLEQEYKEAFEDPEIENTEDSNRQSRIESVVEILTNTEQEEFSKYSYQEKITKLAEKLNYAKNTIISYIEEAIKNGDLSYNDVFTTEEDITLYEKIIKIYEDSTFIGDTITNSQLKNLLEESGEFEDLLKSVDDLYAIIKPITSQIKYDLSESEYDYIEEYEKYEEGYYETYDEEDSKDDNIEDDFPETAEDEELNDTDSNSNIGGFISDNNNPNKLKGNFYDILEDFIDSITGDTNTMINVKNNLLKISNIEIKTPGDIKSIISDYQTQKNYSEENFEEFLDSLTNPCK